MGGPAGGNHRDFQVTCPQCQVPLARIHRGLLGRLLYNERFQCLQCTLGVARRRHLFQVLYTSLRFVFSRHSVCPRCLSGAIYRISSHDRIDSLSRNPLGLLQALLAAPINDCPACRIRFYDWRRHRPRNRATKAAGSPQPARVAEAPVAAMTPLEGQTTTVSGLRALAAQHGILEKVSFDLARQKSKSGDLTRLYR